MKSDPTTEHITDAEDIIARIKVLEAQVQNREPLFVATVNQRGQIVIPVRVRDKLGLTIGSKVAVYHIEAVE
ncbi:AbrB/MazE/SpoVT family DNA-binding domain-containing protein [Candidatus Calescamantes bacterium]|nr:AbrB/MazE/SpoVT family DNA-binding domain-containing protein [Candidatus Calescamantes bacterium]